MTIRLDFRTHAFHFPVATAPPWGGKVERWHQLDACAYGVADAAETWQCEGLDPPGLVILASPGGSNHTDWLFAQTAGTSPSLFVHTLPNTRGSSFCQVMNWNGPVLCIQNDPTTCLTALREAIDLLGEETAAVWIISVQRDRTRDSHYAAHLLHVSHTDHDGGFHIEHRGGADEARPCDTRLLAWLREGHSRESELRLLDGYVVRKWTDRP